MLDFTCIQAVSIQLNPKLTDGMFYSRELELNVFRKVNA